MENKYIYVEKKLNLLNNVFLFKIVKPIDTTNINKTTIYNNIKNKSFVFATNPEVWNNNKPIEIYNDELHDFYVSNKSYTNQSASQSQPQLSANHLKFIKDSYIVNETLDNLTNKINMIDNSKYIQIQNILFKSYNPIVEDEDDNNKIHNDEFTMIYNDNANDADNDNGNLPYDKTVLVDFINYQINNSIYKILNNIIINGRGAVNKTGGLTSNNTSNDIAFQLFNNIIQLQPSRIINVIKQLTDDDFNMKKWMAIPLIIGDVISFNLNINNYETNENNYTVAIKLI
jgi:hypothetical protein